MTMPNFLIIGAAKAGTTSLYHYLAQHPQIYMSPVKEPRFFALEGEKLDFQNPDRSINHTSVTSLEAYCQLFENVSNEIALGEASPLYLYSPRAPKRIKHYIPDVKLVAVLRDPSERAYSCYMHLVREGYEKLSFTQALDEEANRIRQKWAHLWHYQQGGYYYVQLKRYFDIFEREQIKIYLYEDLSNNSLSVTQALFQFLEVDDTFIPDLTRKNVSGIPKSRLLHNIIAKNNIIRSALKPLAPQQLRSSISQSIRNWNLRDKLTLPAESRRHLIELYREDILKLQNLIQRDLSQWLE